MNRSGGGFGICGHKNVYSSKVKEGNWIEDLYGVDMAKTRSMTVNNKQSVNSEHNSNFKAPSSEFMKDLAEYKAKSKTSGNIELEKTVLFNHGMNIFETDLVPYSDAGRDLMRERTRRLKEENDQIYNRMSESRASSQSLPKNTYVRVDPHTETTLPNFARRSNLVREMIKS